MGLLQDFFLPATLAIIICDTDYSDCDDIIARHGWDREEITMTTLTRRAGRYFTILLAAFTLAAGALIGSGTPAIASHANAATLPACSQTLKWSNGKGTTWKFEKCGGQLRKVTRTGAMGFCQVLYRNGAPFNRASFCNYPGPI